jgi:hypothetical protein
MATPMITNWKKLHASDSELVNPTLYRQLIGSLMYLVNTRPDICFTVNTLSQFMMEPRRVHWVAAKHVLRYLQGTVDIWSGLYLRRWSQVDRLYRLRLGRQVLVTGRVLWMLFSCWDSAVVSWFSRKQRSVALSSAQKVEYIAASQASCEAIWLCKMICGLFGQRLRPTMIYCDNQSCIKLTENPVFHDRSKHIEIKYHFIRIGFREEQ